MASEVEQYPPIIVFKGKNIRRTLHNDEWWFVVKDVVEALTDTANVTDYLKKIRQRDPQLSEGWGQIVTPFLSKLQVDHKKKFVTLQNNY